jgi:hypothetical protein
MPGAENDDVVQTLTPNRTDHAFSVWILPRRLRCGRSLLNLERPRLPVKRLPVDRVSISNQVSGRLIRPAGLEQLTCGPDGRRIAPWR